VVVVSLDDDILKETMKQLQEAFPQQQFKSVGCSFSPGVDYLKMIQDATKDIAVPIIFNNAGCKSLSSYYFFVCWCDNVVVTSLCCILNMLSLGHGIL
jgi:hypothetical protein